jgi:hypothetical protein
VDVPQDDETGARVEDNTIIECVRDVESRAAGRSCARATIRRTSTAFSVQPQYGNDINVADDDLDQHPRNPVTEEMLRLLVFTSPSERHVRG